MQQPWCPILGGIAVWACAGLLMGQTADSPPPDSSQLTVSHPECDYFGSQRERYTDAALRAARGEANAHSLRAFTQRVTAMLATASGDGRTRFGQTHEAGSIDSYSRPISRPTASPPRRPPPIGNSSAA